LPLCNENAKTVVVEQRDSNYTKIKSKLAIKTASFKLGIAFMPKALCIFGLVVAGLFVLIFGLDLAIGFPFNGFYKFLMDIPMVLCSIALGFISWMTFREQT
jgi:hypothetical protein